MNPLKSSKKLLSEDQFSIIFGNIPEILQVDVMLLEKLEEVCKVPAEAAIGPVIIEVVLRLMWLSSFVSEAF